MNDVLETLNNALKNQMKLFIEEYKESHEDFIVPEDFYDHYETFFIREYTELFDKKEIILQLEEPKHLVCKALKLNGDPCKCKAKKGELYCAIHLKKMKKQEDQGKISGEEIVSVDEHVETITNHSFCKYIFTKGNRKGEKCSKMIVNGKSYCKTHCKNEPKYPSEEFVENSEGEVSDVNDEIQENQEYIEEYSFE
jgi:hypothetical protein